MVKDTLLVPARVAWPIYNSLSAYICQPGRSFREVKYIAFYADGEIKPVVAQILSIYDNIVFEEGKYSGELGRIVDQSIGIKNHLPGHVQKVMVLSSPNDPRTEHLPYAVKNDLPYAFVQGQRYLALEDTKNAKVTSQLSEDRRSDLHQKIVPLLKDKPLITHLQEIPQIGVSEASGASGLKPLSEGAWKLFQEATQEPCLARPSVPILYFGDYNRYRESPVRVVTVGLNPSDAEFPKEAPFSRFHGTSQLANGSYSPSQDEFHRIYLEALNSYFQFNPYRRWFDSSYGSLLAGMGAGFYGSEANTAIHTDLCSPLATSPTWSQLDERTQLRLMASGTSLWAELIEQLQPNIALVSVAERYLSIIPFRQITPWRTLYTVDRANPYQFRASEMQLRSGKKTLFVLGRASQTPFGSLTSADLFRFGRFLKA